MSKDSKAEPVVMDDYLRSVVPVLDGISRELLSRRPEDPLAFIAEYVIREKALRDARASPPPAAMPHARYIAALGTAPLTVVVIGASGDLAKKKTFPALFNLMMDGLLPLHTAIIGYARSRIDQAAFGEIVFSSLPKAAPRRLKDQFVQMCSYVAGDYDTPSCFIALNAAIVAVEAASAPPNPAKDAGPCRLFYYAIPPIAFASASAQIDAHVRAPAPGWTRVIVEKPFGKDSASSAELLTSIGRSLKEAEVYRIDHYLGKEVVQTLSVLRFANKVFSRVWSQASVASVYISFKENFGTEGRGGYFDEFGIVRDVVQNHLLQILALVAMEKPHSLAAEHIRDAKVRALRSVRPFRLEDSVLGQYEGYRSEEHVPRDSRTPTFALCVAYIDNDRWAGVPFVLKAGKGLSERAAEIRLKFKPEIEPFGDGADRNELVLRVQPNESIYLKVCVKRPRLGPVADVATTSLDLSLREQFGGGRMPDAYEGLIYDAMCGEHGNFVRADELEAAWAIVTPLLHAYEGSRQEPLIYSKGTRGPAEADELSERVGVIRSRPYEWKPPVGSSGVGGGASPPAGPRM